MQAILLTSSLLLVVAMLTCLAWLSTARQGERAEAVAGDALDEPA